MVFTESRNKDVKDKSPLGHPAVDYGSHGRLLEVSKRPIYQIVREDPGEGVRIRSRQISHPRGI